jgi:hypothetical protein
MRLDKDRGKRGEAVVPNETLLMMLLLLLLLLSTVRRIEVGSGRLTVSYINLHAQAHAHAMRASKRYIMAVRLRLGVNTPTHKVVTLSARTEFSGPLKPA